MPMKMPYFPGEIFYTYSPEYLEIMCGIFDILSGDYNIPRDDVLEHCKKWTKSTLHHLQEINKTRMVISQCFKVKDKLVISRTFVIQSLCELLRYCGCTDIDTEVKRILSAIDEVINSDGGDIL